MQIIVGIATMKGREVTLKRTIESLINQVDDIHVYNNEIEPINLTDNGKFHALHLYSEPIYFFSCDDDIIYPSDYISKTIEAIEKHECIVSYHGRRLRGVGLNYYKGHTSFACLGNFPQTCEIDVSGTGVTAFRTDYFNPTEIYKSEFKKMSDLVFAHEAAVESKKIMHIGHSAGWIKYQDIPIGETIYGQEHKNCEIQNKIADKIYLIRN